MVLREICIYRPEIIYSEVYVFLWRSGTIMVGSDGCSPPFCGEIDFRCTFGPSFCRDDYDTRRSPCSKDSSRTGIFEYIYRGDVIGIDIIYTSVVDHSIQYDHWGGTGIQGISSPDFHGRSPCCGSALIGIETRHSTSQHFRNLSDWLILKFLYIDARNRSRQVTFFHRSVSYHDDLIEHLSVRKKHDIDGGLASYRDFLGFKTNVGEYQNRLIIHIVDRI